MGCDAFVEWVKAQGKKTILVCGVEAHICVLQSIIDLIGEAIVYLLWRTALVQSVYNKEYAIQRAVQEVHS